MLDALFAAIDDAQFYQHVDFSDQVSEALFEMDDRAVLFIAGPRTADPARDMLPIYVVAKEDSQTNADMSLSSHGYVVLSSGATGSLIVRRFSPEKKQPQIAADADRAKTPVNAPADYEPKVTTTYHMDYRDLTAEEMPDHDASWTVLVSSGLAVSNALEIQMSGALAPLEAPSTQALAAAATASELDVVPLTNATPIPEGRFHLATNTPGEGTYTLSFSLPDDGMDQIDTIPVHLLFSSKDLETPVLVTLQIPKSATQLTNGTRLAAVRLELGGLLHARLPPGGALPGRVHVLVVSRNVHLLSAPIMVR